MATTIEAIDLVRRLEQISDSCHHSDVEAELIPIREITQEELADTMFASELPADTNYYSLPLLNKEGKRIGGFGYISAIVDVYRDGTAIARTREWKYAYSENEGSLDGKNEVKLGPNHMTVKFYLLGCKHEYEERSWEAAEKGITLYSHDHYHVCKNCGHSYVVDTSG